jgi:hypothetical protein
MNNLLYCLNLPSNITVLVIFTALQECTVQQHKLNFQLQVIVLQI